MKTRLAPSAALVAFLGLVAAVAVLASSCTIGAGGSPAAAPAAGIVPIAGEVTPQLPVTVPAGTGAPDVTVTDVSRIVPLTGSLSEVVFSLGLGSAVVGRDISTTFAEAADLPLVTRAHDVSAEAVLSLRPTLVLAQDDSGPPEALEQIRAAGVPVVVFELPSDIAHIGPRVRAIAATVGLPAEGAALAQRIDTGIETAREAIPQEARETPPRMAFLYMRGQAGVYLMGGPGSGADSMISAAGGVDAGTAAGLTRPFTPITSEALVQAAPEVILMTSTGLDSVGGIEGLAEVPGMAQTPAGREGRVVTVEDGLLYGFGPRTPEVVSALIDDLYFPEGQDEGQSGS